MKAKANLFRTLLVVLVAVAVALFGVGLRTAETQTTTASTTTYYKVQDLGTLGGTYSTAYGINDSGQVVGYSRTNDGYEHAFLYDSTNGDSTNGMKELGSLGGGTSYARALNDSGQVVGSSYTANGEQHAFLYDSTNGMKDLNDLIPADSGFLDSGSPISGAYAINNDGKIAASYDWGGFLLTPATTATSATYEVQWLDTLGLGGDSSLGYYISAAGINDSGQAVGTASPWASMSNESWTPTDWYAFLYDSATPKMQDLGSNLSATGINNSGKVVGYSGSSYYTRAFLYDSATKKMQDLGTVEGYPYSRATSINDSDQVVGAGCKILHHSGTDGSWDYESCHASLKESGQPMIDLNTLIPADSGWTISSASGINSDGKIAATGYKDGVGSHALLLTPNSDSPPPAEVDKTAPTVKDSSVSPASGATKVARNTSVTGTFSEAIDPKTLVTKPTDPANPNVGTSTTFTLVKDGTTTPISAKVSYNDSTKTVTLTPSSNLGANTKYTVKMSGGVKDLAGNALAPYTWSFTTGRQ